MPNRPDWHWWWCLSSTSHRYTTKSSGQCTTQSHPSYKDKIYLHNLILNVSCIGKLWRTWLFRYTCVAADGSISVRRHCCSGQNRSGLLTAQVIDGAVVNGSCIPNRNRARTRDSRLGMASAVHLCAIQCKRGSSVICCENNCLTLCWQMPNGKRWLCDE